MKQVFMSQGGAVVKEVPAPEARPGCVLVRVSHSCISAGTEMSGLAATASEPLVKRALRQPDKAAKVLGMALREGVGAARSFVSDRLSVDSPAGYSAAGVVVARGEGVSEFAPGDKVACAGAQCAHHAEFICVPRNLAVLVPGGLDIRRASAVTLCSIAMQGVRRAAPSLGETFVVIGLGILGQLTAQLLKASGCRVIGADFAPERVRLALSCGMFSGVVPADEDLAEKTLRLTAAHGADGAIITAASSSNDIVSTAFNVCRKKGRVVLVGDVGLNLVREDFYGKEIDFLISSSYGPGRYDPQYEEKGLDYPIGYVRWTENRNMSECLRLMESGALDIDPLISAEFPVDDAAAAYESLRAAENRPMMVLLSYPGAESKPASARKIPNPSHKPSGPGAVRVSLIGSGSFAKAVHLPIIRSMPDKLTLKAVVSTKGHEAAAVAKQFSAEYSTTDCRETLADPAVDAVVIATRHDSHAPLALAALEAGKHVFVEKPTAIDRPQLEKIREFYTPEDGSPRPILMTGYNRRFSPFARRCSELLAARTGPMIINYRMNAGRLPQGHWANGEQSGGRNIGEACHIYDLFTFLTNSRAAKVSAIPVRPLPDFCSPSENFVASISFEDGSLATLTYTSLGSNDHPKETMDIYFDGKVISLFDYERLEVAGAKAQGFSLKEKSKGHKEELDEFASAVRDGRMPIPLWQIFQASEISFQVEDAL
ncbi:MAG: 4-carboxy-2-hydroxymuconate-6-semialdehyde dehydrogenase [bacterium ADurb.Bin236]|nr:MAG: 4-carboxy-2-hydroxymuconate-6-semialdehyde dehydrogenase [bacterium ADurb.Bin236]HOY62986.1 bi-domain-containing oxidoreductase [bacterium]HPN96063.1 bi-domain-containing oxidoreductase [bacterium]